MSKIMKRRLTKHVWYALGGFQNPSLYRRHNGRCWEYWQDTDHPAFEHDYAAGY